MSFVCNETHGYNVNILADQQLHNVHIHILDRQFIQSFCAAHSGGSTY